MPFKRELLPGGIWRIDISGLVTLQDSISNLHEIPKVQSGKDLYSLVIYSDDVVFLLDENARKKNRLTLGKILKSYCKVSIAFVAPSDLIFGHARQICSELEYGTIVMDVFRSEQEALDWLKDMIEA